MSYLIDGDVFFELYDFHKQNGFSPTFSEVASRLQITRSCALASLARLEAQGVIKQGFVPRGEKIVHAYSLDVHFNSDTWNALETIRQNMKNRRFYE